MSTLLAMLATLLRLLRPSRGLHAAPRALRADLREEARQRKAARVRRYAETLPAANGSPRTLVPVPADYVHVVQADAVAEPADIVRGFYRAHEVRQRHARIDRDRLALAVLMDVADSPKIAEASA